MQKVLLTGFEPFGGETLNPSWEAARQLHGQTLTDGRQIVAIQLPCVFATALPKLQQALDEHQPVQVLAIGQAGGRSELTLERVAINLIDARIADNAGEQPIDIPVMPDGPAAYFTTLPLKAMTARLREAGFPASVSHTAGTYVCNQVFYGLMHMASRRPYIKQAGFMHIPYLPAQAARQNGPAPSMALTDIMDGIRLALDIAHSTEQDLPHIGGTTH